MKSNLFHSLICIVSIFACYIASTVKASAETNLEVLATGSCGDNVTYTIYSDYSMVISGTGAMWNYSSDNHIDNDYYSRIKKVIIEDGVTSICDYAFHYFFGLTSVTIPNSVTSIGGNAFYRCSSLTSVTIPNSVTSIGDYAFSGCTGLTSVAIPNSVTSIGDYAFSSCTGLTSVTIPNSVTSIGYYVFNGCSGLTSVDIPNSVTSISGYAFYGCTGLTSVTIPNSVTSIGNCAFHFCSGLTSVTIPNSVTSIGSAAFHGCSSLTSVNIPNSVISIGDGAFYRCNSLSSITVESGNTMYDSRDNCNAIIEKRTNRLIAGCKTTVIPNSVTDIGKDAFGYCSGLTSVTIPNSVTSIGNFAFRGCTGLTSVTIPNSVTSISYSAFSDCTGLTSVTIPNSVTSLESGVFSGCTGLTTITMESDVPLSINRTSFSNVDKTTCILYVPYGSKSAYENAQYWSEFQNIVELEDGGETKPSTYTDSQGVNYQLINNGTAYKVTGHTDDFNLNLIIPAELFDLPVIEIGTFAFQYSALQSIVIPEGLTTIGRNAFHGCDLSSIHIPASVTSLYPETDNCFSANPSLNSITVAEGNSVYDSRDNCNAIIETSSNRLLTGCLGTIIPTSITTIANDAFYGSSFASITIPANIQSIGAISFGSCNELISFKVLSETPFSIDSRIFDESEHNVFEYATLYVPKGSKTLYQQADVWKNFQNIVEFEEGGNTDPEDGVLQPDGTATWTTFQGVKMTFKVIDAEKKWVQVGNGVDPSISQSTTGEVTIPNEIVIDGETYTVVGIGDYGFYNCDKLTAIWLPDNLQFIGKYAFYGCKLVGKIQIPETVYAIDDTAFEGCTGLTEISCPYIPGFSYPSVPNLKIIGYKPSDEDFDVVIPQPVTSIGERAFSYCANIRTMRVEEGNTVFDSRDNCNAIIRTADNVLLFGCKSTEIPSSVTAIDAYAFEGHTGLSTIAIPASVASIGKGAFADCTGLTTVTSNIQSPYAINDNTFSTTTYETATLYVPYGTKSAYQAADGWKNFLNIVEMEEELDVLATGQCGDNLTYTIYSDYSMVISGTGEMWNYGWNNHINNDYYQSIEKVVIGDGVTKIGNYAFVYSHNLSSVTIGNSVTTIGNDAFYNLIKLTSITIPNSVTSIESRAFDFCFGLTSVTIGNSVTTIGYDAFNSCYNLESLSIPSSVTDINNTTFRGCYSLSSIVVEAGNTVYDSRDNCSAIIKTATNQLIAGCKNTIIPSSITSIGNYAFLGSAYLTSIAIPSGVTEIGSDAFKSCSRLTSVSIPNSVTIIGADAFTSTPWYDNQPDGLVYINNVAYKYKGEMPAETEIVIRNGTVSISPSAFIDCTGMTALTIPSGLTSIGKYAFRNCTGLASVTFPNSLNTIGDYAFSGCSGLTSLNIPNSITTISSSAFIGCSGLTSVTIPNSVSSIEDCAFQDCTSLQSIYVERAEPATIGWYGAFVNVDKSICTLYVPRGSKSAYENAEYWSEFENIVEVLATGQCGDNLTYTICSNNTMVISGTGTMWDFWQVDIENYVIPWADYHGSIEFLLIEEGVTSISEGAFSSFSELISINLPNSLIEISDLAFSDCSGLTSVVIPKSVTYIGINPFVGCNGLSSIVVDSDNTEYCSRDNSNAIIETSTNTLIAGCKNTVIPNSVASIGFQAFAHCEYLTSLDIPNSVISIEAMAFSCCYQLTSITIPGTVTTIGNNAFQYCYGLTSVSIPNGMISIGSRAFECCNRLTAVAIPESVSSLGENVFSNCFRLSSITVDANNNYFDSRNNCNAIIEKSTNALLFGCLNTIVPSDVTSIEKYAFAGCKALESIIIPNRVTTIGNYAFYGCNGLTSITTESSEPASIERYTFFSVNKSTCTLYVPYGSKSAYENAEYWNEFENIVEYDSEPDTDISTLDNVIYVDHIEGRIGGTMDIPIKVKNSAPIEDFKFKMILPAGTTVNSWALSSNRLPSGATVDDHFSEQNIVGNTITLACSLNYNESEFTGNDGEIATVNVTFGENMEVGTYPIRLIECNIGHIDLSDVKATLNLEDYVVGDANGDGRVRIGDASAILHYIVGNPSADFQAKAADVNGDGLVRIGDVSAVLKIIVGL